MKLSKIFLSLLLVTFIVFPISAFGSETRVGSMGGVGMFIRDDTNIFAFPGTIAQYPNMAIAEMRMKFNEYSIGTNLDLEGRGIIGVYLNTPLNLGGFKFLSDIVDLQGGSDLDKSLDVFYSIPLGGFNTAFQLSLAMDSFKGESVDPDYEESVFYLGLGGGISNEMMDIGVKLEIPSMGWEQKKAEEKWGGFGLGVNARSFLGDPDGLEIVPLGIFYLGPSSYEYVDSEGKTYREVDFSALRLAAGVGFNYHLNDDNLLVIGIKGLDYTTLSTDEKDAGESSDTAIMIPGISLGVESRIKSWLTGRFGAIQTYTIEKEENKPKVGDDTEDSEYDSYFDLSFGIGIHFGDFTLDASVNEGLLFDGPSFVSNTNEVFSKKLSLIYHY